MQHSNDYMHMFICEYTRIYIFKYDGRFLSHLLFVLTFFEPGIFFQNLPIQLGLDRGSNGQRNCRVFLNSSRLSSNQANLEYIGKAACSTIYLTFSFWFIYVCVCSLV